MADQDYDFEKYLSGRADNPDLEGETNTPTTGATSNTSTTKNTMHPFSARLGEDYVKIIKAMAWWKRMSQREFIEEAVNQYLNDFNPKELEEILTQYHENN